ncbi:ATPase [Amycolatopsis antarctica]|uniref:ATPase n=1 Tax=Amycolatopsis antarctica TaxID=1854586 RepID=A0A263CY19_9PSEU|nr:Clp protease N-terminal domain-containing protein [Amycolatopsis antarctica]OZM70317.1 ATPase [Amycolatopsis antarctica]
MFERFSRNARLAVVGAQESARAAHAPEIGAEHLLLALLDGQGYAARYLADRLGGDRTLAAEFDRIRRQAGLGPADARALGELGIDVRQVVDAVEREHGPGALARPREPGRRRGHLPFDREAKLTLKRTLGEAIALGDRSIGTEHVLLALLNGTGAVADVLAAHEIGYLDLRSALARRQAS